ncbi:MAG: SDR family oxidoreductase [Candidatus Eremiobacteraeota bacterium]|nr:SDR family oxidoreductase [Candidatus Eremiobacteraeota bacterium]
MSYTVVGARGFIGSAFLRALQQRGIQAVGMSHDEALLAQIDLGDVIYASGIAWDAQKRPDDAQRLHAAVPAALLAKRLRSFTYISSTRVYGFSTSTQEDNVRQFDASDVYAATKTAGENAVLNDPRPRMRVLRLSNVYGPSFRSGLMLSDFLRQAATTGRIVVRSSRDSEKDHVSIDDVVDVGLRIAFTGRERLYNIAAGRNTKQGLLLDAIAAASKCTIEIMPDAPAVVFAPIDVARVRKEFGFETRDVLDDLPRLWREFKDHFAATAQVAQ